MTAALVEEAAGEVPAAEAERILFALVSAAGAFREARLAAKESVAAAWNPLRLLECLSEALSGMRESAALIHITDQSRARACLAVAHTEENILGGASELHHLVTLFATLARLLAPHSPHTTETTTTSGRSLTPARVIPTQSHP